METTNSSEYTTVSVDRLKELEILESSIPKLIEEAIAEYKKSNLKKLHERDKANPDAINKRVKRYFERHREEINARRREKRQKEKTEKKLVEISTNTTLPTSVSSTKNELVHEEPVKVESIFMRAATDAVSKSEIPIVRKQAKPKKKDKPMDITEREDTNDLTLGLTRTNNITVRFDT
jgi:hypothetical protein